MSMIARPASDVSEGSWTPTPLYSRLNEIVPDDTTKVDSGTAPDTFQVALSPLGWPPPGPQVLSVRLRQAGDEPTTAVVKLLQGTQTIAVWVITAPPDFTTFNFTLLPTQVSQITDYTALSLQVTIPVCSGSSSGAGVIVPCCPGTPMPLDLNISWATANQKLVWLPNPIPLHYSPLGFSDPPGTGSNPGFPPRQAGWYSSCLTGAALNPGTGFINYYALQLLLLCAGVGDILFWNLVSATPIGSPTFNNSVVESTCDPVGLDFGDILVWEQDDSATPLVNCFMFETATGGPVSPGLGGVIITQ